MKSQLKEKIKQKQVEYILQSDEYVEALKELCNDILNGCKNAPNEASVVSVFEIELYGLIHDLGLKYYPEKEVLVNTQRHIAKGRIDSKFGALVVEYKQKKALQTEEQRKEATEQIVNYIESLYKTQKMDYLGLITDGIKCKFINCLNGKIIEEAFEDLSYKHLDRLIKSIILLFKVALTPKNLVKDFTEPENDNISNKLTLELYNLLENHATRKTLMLFDEWKELFRLAHDDISKQRAIEERKKALSHVIGKELSNNDEQYLALYALQTTYAIIVKIIAYKVISRIRFNKSLIEFNKLADADFETLRIQLNSLEEGAIFRNLGIGNLLEGDFFSWYSTQTQWSNKVGVLIKEIFAVLARYEDKAIFETGENVQDLFKDLFLKIVPDKVRHSLGEFYTPGWLADNLVSEAISILGNSDNWNAIDPCAGSGTFVTVLIKRVLAETKGLTRKKRLNQILTRVKAIDLNPLTVLTARINYFINISPLISERDTFEIPVYLGDSSYVPEKVVIDNVPCLKYKIKTIKGDIDIELPQSAVANTGVFSKTMTAIEEDIRNLDAINISKKLLGIINIKERTKIIIKKINVLSKKFVELEKNDWNGIWARVITNFLTTANLGKFDLIVGNPPWIDWKNLPSGYRDRIKSICIARHLFSGDSITGGINLNICGLIANVSAQNWLKENGVLGFLMPQTILFQQTYEGFRNFALDNNKRLYFQRLSDWTKAGYPFEPVRHKFLMYFLFQKFQNYRNGIPVKFYIKEKKLDLQEYRNEIDFNTVQDAFSTKEEIVGQVNPDNTTFTYAKNKIELKKYRRIVGRSSYIGREGIEFFPQELFLLEVDNDLKQQKSRVFVKNFQNEKSKYKIPQNTFLLEKKYLQPLIKGIDIERFYINKSAFLVPFPYEPKNTRSPLNIIKLSKKSPLLAKYFNQFKKILQSQTTYSEKIIGKKHFNEFYALARVGSYSFAKNYVAFRDNSKWQAAVVSEIETPWGEMKRPQFQNHAVSICETQSGRYITLDEAHFICAILNAPLTRKYILNSSDSRSFKIRPPVYIPIFDASNEIHAELSNLSKLAHETYDDKKAMKKIDSKLDKLILKLPKIKRIKIKKK